MKRGLFVTLEGGEGGGKSTQAALAVRGLKAAGIPVVHTREPGGTRVSEAVRRTLLDPRFRVDPLAELLLYEAARAQHVAEVIRPALRRGSLVLCERYTDATEAYQGYGRGLDLGDIRKANRVATGGLNPDLTFLLDVPVRSGLASVQRLGREGRRGRPSGGDRMERESAVFHERVRRGYRALARRDRRRFRVIPWGRTIDVVQETIMREIERRWRSRR